MEERQVTANARRLLASQCRHEKTNQVEKSTFTDTNVQTISDSTFF